MRRFVLVVVGVSLVATAIVLALLIAWLQVSGGGAEFFHALQLLLSWPVVVMFVALVAIVMFRRELTDFLAGMTELGVGSVKVSRAQQPARAESGPPPPENLVPTSTKGTATPSGVGAVLAVGQVSASGTSGDQPMEKDGRAGAQSHEDLLAKLAEEVVTWKVNARNWFFEYLFLFLRPQTKASLWWVANRSDPSEAGKIDATTYHLAWAPFIPDAQERAVILSVLENNRLLETTPTGGLRVTNLGRGFLGLIAARGEGPNVYANPSGPRAPWPVTVAEMYERPKEQKQPKEPKEP